MSEPRAADGGRREVCDSTLGIGVPYVCELPKGHVPPHRVEGYGGLWTSWRVEWFTVAEEERDAIER